MLELDVLVVQSRITLDGSAEEARSECLAVVVERSQAGPAGATLYIERRDGLDHHDRETILCARRNESPLNFEHLPPHSDPLLWVPDAFAWAVGARGQWLGRVSDAVVVQDLS